MKYLFFNALGIGLVFFSNSPRGWTSIFTCIGVVMVGITQYERDKSDQKKIKPLRKKIHNNPTF